MPSESIFGNNFEKRLERGESGIWGESIWGTVWDLSLIFLIDLWIQIWIMGESCYKEPLWTTWALTEICMNYSEPNTGYFLNYIMVVITNRGKEYLPGSCYWNVLEHRTDSAAEVMEPNRLKKSLKRTPPQILGFSLQVAGQMQK